MFSIRPRQESGTITDSPERCKALIVRGGAGSIVAEAPLLAEQKGGLSRQSGSVFSTQS